MHSRMRTSLPLTPSIHDYITCNSKEQIMIHICKLKATGLFLKVGFRCLVLTLNRTYSIGNMSTHALVKSFHGVFKNGVHALRCIQLFCCFVACNATILTSNMVILVSNTLYRCMIIKLLGSKAPHSLTQYTVSYNISSTSAMIMTKLLVFKGF